MIKNSAVMKIFLRSSGILKIVMILFIVPFLQIANRRPHSIHNSRNANSLPSMTCLGGTRLHFVSDRFLRRGDDVGFAALGFDLGDRRLRVTVRAEGELLGQFAATENTDAVGGFFRQPFY